MNAMNRFVMAMIVAASALGASGALAQGAEEYRPQVGQYGKDVIWVPTPDMLVERMLTMAQTTPRDFVVDLGAGDGRIAIAAAKKFGAKSLGVEFNPDMVAVARRNAKAAREPSTCTRATVSARPNTCARKAAGR